MEKLASMRGTDDIRELPLGLVRVSPDALAWLRGARGELEMARELERLGSAWTVLHSIPVGEGDSDIDHLAIGPTGVYPINTKRHVAARIWARGHGMRVSGQRVDHLRNSAHEADRVRRVLGAASAGIDVVPVVAISGAQGFDVDRPEWYGERIEVLPVAHVVRRLRRRRRAGALPPERIDEVARLLGDSAAWRRLPAVEADASAREAFRLIDRGVRRWDAVVALAWLVGAALLAAVAVTAGPAILRVL
jgi:hypothetical protein